MTGLADCNNFFVSCERSINPSLEGIPVVVLSNNDGCVVARSNEAKLLGIKMGQPAFEIKDMILKGQVTALSGNHLLYREISLQVHDIFRRYAPSTIDYSVDEAFLIMDGIPDGVLPEIGEEIRKACQREAGIPVTIGFAPSKTLAKVATESGKKAGRSVVVLNEKEEIWRLLDAMPIGDLWGIGRRLCKKMYLWGVYSVGDFARKPLSWVRARLGVVGERSWRELHGEPCIELSHVDRTLQDSISETRTFPEDIDDFDYLRSRMAIYCGHITKRLRAMGGEAGEIQVFLRTNRFHLEKGVYSPCAGAELNPPTSDSAVITGAAIALLRQIFRPEFKYKRGGVVLSRIRKGGIVAPSLFDEGSTIIEAMRKSKSLMQAIDSLNTGVGQHVLKLASELTAGHPGHNDGYSSSFGAPKADPSTPK